VSAPSPQRGRGAGGEGLPYRHNLHFSFLHRACLLGLATACTAPSLLASLRLKEAKPAHQTESPKRERGQKSTGGWKLGNLLPVIDWHDESADATASDLVAVALQNHKDKINGNRLKTAAGKLALSKASRWCCSSRAMRKTDDI
jgi:hypothetical protein